MFSFHGRSITPVEKEKADFKKQRPTVQTVLLNLLELVIEYLFFWNKSSEHLLSLLGEKEENNNELTGKTTWTFHLQADKTVFSSLKDSSNLIPNPTSETAFNHQSGQFLLFCQAINYVPNAFH